MRAVVQRVSEAKVSAEGEIVGSIGKGLLVLIGIRRGDTPADAEYLADKIVHLRLFEDEEGKLNRSLQEIGGAALLISQFTLYGDARKGRRPSFTQAASGEEARALYEMVCNCVAAAGIPVARGAFGAKMQVSLINEGPVTLLLDSERIF
jgi:D-tyrosyl-tRNA(Tyr) deacylase